MWYNTNAILGCSQAVRHQTLTLAFRWFEPIHPSQNKKDTKSVSFLFCPERSVWPLCVASQHKCGSQVRLKPLSACQQKASRDSLPKAKPPSIPAGVSTILNWEGACSKDTTPHLRQGGPQNEVWVLGITNCKDTPWPKASPVARSQP